MRVFFVCIKYYFNLGIISAPNIYVLTTHRNINNYFVHTILINNYFYYYCLKNLFCDKNYHGFIIGKLNKNKHNVFSILGLNNIVVFYYYFWVSLTHI